MDPIEAFRADGAAVAVVGAGGKKTTMYALANRLDRAVVTATVRIPIFDPHVATVSVTPDPVERLERSAAGAGTAGSDAAGADAAGSETAKPNPEFPLGLVPAREREDRYLGYDRETVSRIIDSHDGPVLIKADGARTREFKAPGESEPQIPDAADVVVPVASVAVVGEPLTEDLVHRPERVVDVARGAGLDVAIGDAVTPELVGTVLASPAGGLAGVPDGACAIPLLNKVDDADAAATAREIAAVVRERMAEQRRETRDGTSLPSVPHVVLGRLVDEAVVDVVPVEDANPVDDASSVEDTSPVDDANPIDDDPPAG
ncbi:selenium cofactor biosynthesis protein YqeC [Halopenitus persicus]|uniref:Probable selenium-dependent hydroxylase accessory protein YqeC n=1 Tax=Halopenitus persicus TaxID=1048396 RepID=A0A1H3KTX3_9EURY|nr:selenium cofactor biosynthesis protein YqeC [Halopenitus persicus]SDY55198.1 probable selenium-dependent hydroxylase accessory protein YqeC [Halopenitus persicus]